MKKISKKIKMIIMLLFLGAMASAQTPSVTQNYTMETLVKHQGHKTSGSLSGLPVDSANRTISYIDGLGRPLQTVQWQGSPDKKDIVSYNVYDALGREAVKYLPYAEQSGSDASYKTAATTNQASFYGSGSWDANIVKTAYPYSRTVFEASPFNRVLEQGAPGAVWQPYSGSISGSGHSVKVENTMNSSGEVAFWTVGSSGASASSSYAAGTLFKTISRDENWSSGKAGTTAEFKDKQGRVILKRQWSSTDSLSTFYVYDDYNNLRYVVPPAVTASFNESDAAFSNHVYAYRYDGRRRIIQKKIPGKGWEDIIYNVLDQMVFTQDAVQAGKVSPERSFVKYDALGRVIMTGYETGHTSTRTAMQAYLDTQTLNWEQRDASGYHGYTNVSTPGNTSTMVPLVVNYYDDYSFPGYGSTYYPSITYSNKTKGLLTGTKTLVLGTSTFLLTVMHYDDEGRLVEMVSDNHLGGTDRVTNTYNFAGELVTALRTHIANSTTTTIANSYTYDHVGRKISTKENINSQGDVWLNKMEYNGIGQLKQKNLHSTNGSTFMHNTKLSYNERGWLRGSISNEFSMKLGYDTLSNPQYNGNISAQLWGSGTSFHSQFDYLYDKLNRLIKGSTAIGSAVSMSEEQQYDVMGNITAMSRDMLTTGNYSYVGNQLTGISPGPLATGTYLYDGNGNATTDGRTGATIAYNFLNLPVSFSKSSPNAINLTYTYDATGRKLKKVNSTTSTTTDYVGGIQYSNGSIEFIQTEEGRALNSGGTYSYEYNLTDHLGNVRFSFKENPSTHALDPIQQDNYYAFGLRKVASAGTNNYLYNSKELQDELGQYDYGARFYDPVVGRWNAVDPLAETMRRYSPYNYAFNNPIRFIDPDGMDPEAGVYNQGDKNFYENLAYYGIGTNYQNNASQDENDGEGPGEGSTSFNIQTGRNAKGAEIYTGITITANKNTSQGGIDYSKTLNGTATMFSTFGNVGDIAAFTKDGLIESRNALPLMQRVGMASNLKTIAAFGTASKWLGRAGYAGAGLSVVVDYNKMNNGELSKERFSYNTVGTVSALVVGAVVGSVPGAIIGASFVTGQIMYDGFNSWRSRLSWGLSNMVNTLERSIPRQ